jgi:Family of unknown function (DUF5681)
MGVRDGSALAQKAKVRGRPFQPGNPGRPPGSKNKTTRLVEQLVEGDAEELSRKMLELAKKGNVRCLEYCLDRLLPKRSGRPLDLQLPAIKSVHDLIAAMSAISTAVNNGDLTAKRRLTSFSCLSVMQKFSRSMILQFGSKHSSRR